MTDEQSEPIRVLLVDDEALLRAGVRMVLSHAPDIDVVAEACDGAEGVDLALRHRVDVVLMDIRMPGMDGLTAVERLTTLAPSVRTVVLTTLGEDEYVTRALTAGAAGFVFKDTAPRDLIHAVRVAAAGDAILSPRITRRLIEQHVTANATRGALVRQLVGRLTERERDVLVLIGLGMSNGEAGRRLSLGEGTVKTHVNRIFAKLDLRDRAAAIVLAFDSGLVVPRERRT